MVLQKREDMKRDPANSARTDWVGVWELEDVARWDYLSQMLLNEMESVAGGLEGKKIAEIGSGSGRVSAAISKLGGRVTLMDKEEGVLRRSKARFLSEEIKGSFVAGSLPEAPLKDGEFDIVWSAGLLEHFSLDDLKLALIEMARICKPGGFIITMNPYGGSVLHALGVKFLIKRSVYPFMDEKPMISMRDAGAGADLELKEKEYSSGFILLFVGMFKRLALFPALRKISSRLFWSMSDAMCFLDSSIAGKIIRFIDRIFSRIFGGYILVSVFSPKPPGKTGGHL